MPKIWASYNQHAAKMKRNAARMSRADASCVENGYEVRVRSDSPTTHPGMLITYQSMTSSHSPLRLKMWGQCQIC